MVNHRSAMPAASTDLVKVRCSLVWSRHCGVRRLTGLAAAALIAAVLSGCGSGDSTVAKTPQPTTHPTSSRGPRTSPAGGDRRPDQHQLRAGRPVRDQSRRTRDRQGGIGAAPRPAQPAAVEPRTAGRQLQRVRPAVRGDRQGQHQRPEPQHPGGAVSSRQVDTAAGSARNIRIQRDRHLAMHRRHGGIGLLRRHRLAECGEVPLERQRGGADQQHRGLNPRKSFLAGGDAAQSCQ